MSRIIAYLFGCLHRRQTWPMRLPGETVARRSCLDCGARLDCRTRRAGPPPQALITPFRSPASPSRL